LLLDSSTPSPTAVISRQPIGWTAMLSVTTSSWSTVLSS
jgi:hypothetical protein